MAAAAQPTQVPHPRHPAPGAGPGPRPGHYRGPHGEDPHQRTPRPFFYVQPPQPYLPYQWAMPYNPYCGFPAMGYGMVPPFALPPPPPPAPYVDGPSFIMPHTPLHLVDYRQMINPQMINPQMAPAMAYQARRFRYHATQPRVMVSSEVQTEPVEGTTVPSPSRSTSSDGGPNGPGNSGESGRGTCCISTASVSTNTSMSSSPTPARIPDCSEPVVAAATKRLSSSTPFGGAASPKTSRVFQNHVLFQAEEVQIECNGSDFQIAHREETAQLVSETTGPALNSTTGAQVLTMEMEGAVQNLLPQLQPEKLQEDVVVVDVAAGEQITVMAAADSSDATGVPPCPDILLMGASPSAGNVESSPPVPEGSAKKAPTPRAATPRAATPNPATPNATVLNASSADQAENVALDHSTSVVLSTDSKMVSQDKAEVELEVVGQQGLFNSKDPPCKVLHLPFELQFGEVQHMETSVWSVESLMPYIPNREWLIQNGLATHVEDPAESLPQDQEPIVATEADLHDAMMSLPGHDGPSGSWLTDFGNVFYYRKFQPNGQPQPQHCSHARKLKAGLHMSQSSESLSSRRAEESGRRKPRAGVPSDLSDGEGQPTSPRREGLLSPCSRHRQCVCGRSLTKRGSAATSPTPSMKRLRPPNSQPNDPSRSPREGVCKCVPIGGKGNNPTKGSGSDVPGRLNDEDTTDGEASENSLGSLTGVKRSSAQKLLHAGRHSDKCPMAQRSKLREQNCSCDVPRCGHLSWDRGSSMHSQHSQQSDPGWERGFPFGHHSEDRLPRRSLMYDSVPVKGPNHKPHLQSQGSHRKISRC
ncbi:uncharacterized protein buc2l [Engraulis encrasicolus]|uniref:uncharacterized protein buc2l n=1 Tax=Engraulis encrasicolus TaxID=184585 RepID=UPI002FD76415